MSCITTKLEGMQLTFIALSVFVTNLFRIQRRIDEIPFQGLHKSYFLL